MLQNALLHCAKVRGTGVCGNFLLAAMSETKLTASFGGVGFIRVPGALRIVVSAYMTETSVPISDPEGIVKGHP
jgi:hypothetical protein